MSAVLAYEFAWNSGPWSPAYAASMLPAFFFFVLRGTQRISTVCPTAGAQALVMSRGVCHDIRASQGQHCTAECRFSLCEH